MSLTPEQTARVAALVADLARTGRTEDLVEFLTHGFPVDVTTDSGDSLVMLAAYHGQVETLAALIEHGADVDLRNDRDQSPMAGALFKGEQQVVEMLRSAGADVDAGTPSAREAARMFGQTL